MARILDMGSDWKLVLDENVTPIEEINKPEEGYVALIGENNDTGLHTISYVRYSKEYMDVHGNLAKRSVDDILHKVDELKNCQRCSTLDKEKLNVESIELQSQNSSGIGTINPQQTPAVLGSTPSVPSFPPVSKPEPVKDLFSGIMMDALLTGPGKYFLGTVLNDESLVNSAIANKDPAEFAEEMFDFMEGKTDMVRSSDDAHDFLSLMRESKESKSTLGTKRVRSVGGPRTVIY